MSRPSPCCTKAKGKQKDPNNWRDICLKEMTSKVVSSITASHPITVLDNANVAEQFTTIGFQEAIHTLCDALALHHLHDKETCILFVDLAKAYDTVNHNLLLNILEKYGIPNKLVDVLRRMYVDCEIEISVGKGKKLIDYLTGIQQGDNVSPVLFLFLMLAVSQALKEKWNFTIP
jgi:hypothetical protein